MARRLAAALVALIGALILGTGTASAAPGVIQDIAGCHTNRLEPNDDGSSDEVTLGFTANMFDSSFNHVYVNNNGNITVDAPLSKFTPFDFRETGSPSISPFFADVDTSLEGEPGHVDYGPIQYGGKAALCVIWDHVGYFSEHDGQAQHLPGDPRQPGRGRCRHRPQLRLDRVGDR